LRKLEINGGAETPLFASMTNDEPGSGQHGDRQERPITGPHASLPQHFVYCFMQEGTPSPFHYRRKREESCRHVPTNWHFLPAGVGIRITT
jgi:hypothetical protein